MFLQIMACKLTNLTKIVLLRSRTTASLKSGKPWQNLVDLEITGRTCLRELMTDFFAKEARICPVRPGPKWNRAVWRPYGNIIFFILFCFVSCTKFLLYVLYLRIRLFALLTAGKGNGTGVYAEISFPDTFYFFFAFYLPTTFTHTHIHDPRPLPMTHDPRHLATSE